MSFTIAREVGQLPSYTMLCKLAEDNHVRLTGNELAGSFSGGGVEGHYEFTENGISGTFLGHKLAGHFSFAIGTVTVTVKDKPFWLPEALVKQKIADGLDTFGNALRNGGLPDPHPDPIP
jgi:hypothetical protein